MGWGFGSGIWREIRHGTCSLWINLLQAVGANFVEQDKRDLERVRNHTNVFLTRINYSYL